MVELGNNVGIDIDNKSINTFRMKYIAFLVFVLILFTLGWVNFDNYMNNNIQFLN